MDLTAREALARPVTLATLKADPVFADGTIEARMAEEGRRLREAEAKEKEQRAKDAAINPTLRRRPGHKSLASVETFRMPGRFE